MASFQKYKTKNGYKWMFKIYTHIDPKTGKRKTTTRRGFKTKGEAQNFARIMENELASGTYLDNDISFKEFCEEWFNIYKEEKVLKPKTIDLRKYQKDILLDYFQNIKLKDITLKQYMNVLRDLRSKHSESTVNGIHSTAKMIFKKAMQLEIIQKDPIKYSYIPKIDNESEANESPVPKYMEKEELAKFLAVTKEHGLELDYEIFLTLAYTGLRVGELCALQETDLTKEDSYLLDINKTYYNKGNTVKYTLVRPKTRTSKRIIDIDENVANVLKELIEKNNKAKKHYSNYHDHGFIFANLNEYPGYPVYPTVIRYRLKRLLRIAELNEHLTPHSFRHTHTSLLAEAGVSLESIMERLGHSNDGVTRQIYLHTTKAVRKSDAEKFSNLMKDVVIFDK